MARRNKREPFNPFAPGASSKSQKKVQKQRPVVGSSQTQNLSRQEQIEAMKKKIRDAAEKAAAEKAAAEKEVHNKQIQSIEKTISEEPKVKEEPKKVEPEVKKEEPKVKEEPKKVEPKKVEPKKVEPKKVEPKVKEEPKKVETEVKKESNKLDDLKRRSDALAAKTGVTLPKRDTGTGSLFSKTKEPKKPEKKIIKKTKTFRKTKTGGGRQPKQRKLNRRKQLEFRFDARAILDNSSVLEEHRSNVFGQIWAKGERIGIDSAIEYISLKEQEGILTSDVSGELIDLIKSYTIKR